MKDYKVKITRNFTDLEENIKRELGTGTEVFFCTKERYEYLLSKNAVELVEKVEIVFPVKKVTKIEEEKVEEKPKKKRTRKIDIKD